MGTLPGRYVLIDATLAARDGCGDDLAALMRATQQACAHETGCLAYRFTRDLEDEDRFHVFELWANESALAAHMAAAPFKAFIAGLSELGRLVKSSRHIGLLEPYNGGLHAERAA